MAAHAWSGELPEEQTFQSADFGFHVDYPSDWKLQGSNGAGALFDTRHGQLQVAGRHRISSAPGSDGADSDRAADKSET